MSSRVLRVYLVP